MDYRLFFAITFMVGSLMPDEVTGQFLVMPLNTSISSTSCGTTKLCLSTPDNCTLTGNTSCLFASISLPLGTNVTVELYGNSGDYIALGVNPTNSTANATMFACANITNNATLFTVVYNNGSLGQNNIVNVSSVLGSINNSVIQCSFGVSGFSPLLTVNGTMTSTYAFLANGTQVNGKLQQPSILKQLTQLSFVTPTTTPPTATPPTATPPTATPPTAINVTRFTGNITSADCGSKKRCLNFPIRCDPASGPSCLFTSTNQTSQSTTAFQLQGQSNGYIAVGLTATQTSALSNNFYMFACAQNNGTVQLYNIHVINNTLLQNTDSSVNSAQGSSTGNLTQCIFNIGNLNSSLLSRASSLNFNVFLATGNITNGTLTMPTAKAFSNLIDLAVNGGTSPIYSILAFLIPVSVMIFQLF